MSLFSFAVKEPKKARNNGEIMSPRSYSEPTRRGPLAPWGSIHKYMGDSNICDSKRKEMIEKQIVMTILRPCLSLGFAENPHFLYLVELLCPTYARSGNAFPDALMVQYNVPLFCSIILL
jgi:hypothetical protein